MLINRDEIYKMAREKYKSLENSRWKITRLEALNETLDDLFTDYAWPGGYPVEFTGDGFALCAKCARKAVVDDREEVYSGIYYEGMTEYCDDCNVEIESAYGDPDEEDL